MQVLNAATLAEALGLHNRRVVAFTGGGGKTTAMFRLARELAGKRVLVTTTTKIWVPCPEQAELMLADDLDVALERLSAGWEHGIRALGTALTPEGKLQGIPPGWVARLTEVADRVLVEADGAAGKPLTAPRDYEPVIPDSTELLVPVCGADVVGAPLDAEHVHRAAEVAALTGLPVGDPLTPAAIADVLLDPRGNVKGAPVSAEMVPLVNKVDGLMTVGAHGPPDEAEWPNWDRACYLYLGCAAPVAQAAIDRGVARVVLASLISEPPEFVVLVPEASPVSPSRWVVAE